MERPCLNHNSILFREDNTVPYEAPTPSQMTAKGRLWRRDKPVIILNRVVDNREKIKESD